MTVTEHWVAIGPVAGTWWCILDDPAPEQLAPGGVVLCIEQTITPHPDAQRAAVTAWEIFCAERDMRDRALDTHPRRTT